MTTNSQTTETINFEFKNGELFILIDNEPIDFQSFSHQLWNDLVLDKTYNGDIGIIAGEYEKHISAVKQHAIPYGNIKGVRINREITRISTKHLEFILKMATKQLKTKAMPSTSGTYTVLVNTDTMAILCLSCGTRPTDGTRLLKCGKCLLANYCGPTCQKTHWKTHKLTCCK